ncbi:MAG: ribonuclease [Haloplasmataceae bacterium]|jgi:ribonuclease PH|nr:ribonuclease [Haloplasmataceae bacterium]
MRDNNRKNDEKRKVSLELDINMHAEGSVLVSFGNTKVICTASIEDKPPVFLRGGNKGWVTAEYSMIPRATNVRTQRESARGKLTGRTMEIQRLVGRALRSVVDLYKLGERSIIIDCDVIQADGGTRTASITGGFVAMKIAIDKLIKAGTIKENPIKEYLAAISVGINEGEIILDLEYEEDSNAQVDMNVVLTESGKYVEIQGTGEEATFDEAQLAGMLALAKKGIKELIEVQKEALGELNGSSVHSK